MSQNHIRNLGPFLEHYVRNQHLRFVRRSNRQKAMADDMLHDGKHYYVVPDQCRTHPPGPNCHNQRQPEIFFANGIQTTWDNEKEYLQEVANLTGMNIDMIHNGTHGLNPAGGLQDYKRMLTSDAGRPAYPGATTERRYLKQALLSEKPVILMCHSAGCVMQNEALQTLMAELTTTIKPGTNRFYTGEEVLELMRAKGWKRYDFGPACSHLWPGQPGKGPRSVFISHVSDVANRRNSKGKGYDETRLIPDNTRAPGTPVRNLLHELAQHSFKDAYVQEAKKALVEATGVRLQHGPAPISSGSIPANMLQSYWGAAPLPPPSIPQQLARVKEDLQALGYTDPYGSGVRMLS